jgi:molecular chaperone Hsp33
MNDYLIRATSKNKQIRAFACTTKETVEVSREAHNTSPVMTAALGRLLSAGLMMGAMLKGENDILTLRVEGNGPAKGMLVTANSKGNVKGYAMEPQIMLPPNEDGKLDVGGAIGSGNLQVIKDMGLKEPYTGKTELISGEIAEDLTYYFANSEQVPSAVGLGVLMNRDNTVKQAGGFIVQLMPYAEEETIQILENNILKIQSVTQMLDEGKTPEEILEMVLGELGLDVLDKTDVSYQCDCSKKRVEKALISVGEKDLQEMIADGKEIEVNCHFCNKNYMFSVEELKEMVHKAKK